METFEGYLKGMLKRYGQKVIDDLEIQRHNKSKMMAFEVKLLIETYKAKDESMIKKVDMYTLLCDNCGKDLCADDPEFSCWNDVDFIICMAEEAGWLTAVKHYCFECVTYDDNDNIVLKKIDPKEDKL